MRSGHDQWSPGSTDAAGTYDIPCTTPLSQPTDTVQLLVSAQSPEPDSGFGDPALNYAYTFVGGDALHPVQLPCGPVTDPPVVTTMHPGGIITGHEYAHDGTPADFHLGIGYYEPPVYGAVIFAPTGGNHEYRVVGLPPGDYMVQRGTGAGLDVVHVDAGATTVKDWWLGTPDGSQP